MMKTYQAFDMMASILPDMATITADQTVVDVRALLEKKENKVPTSEVMGRLMPVFLTRHRESFMRIAAAFQGVTVDELIEQPFDKTLETFKEGYGDFMLFFGLCLRLVMTA